MNEGEIEFPPKTAGAPASMDGAGNGSAGSQSANAVIARLGTAALSRLEALAFSEDEKVALAAIQEILNRAFGKVAPTPARPERPERSPECRPVIQIINYADWLEQQGEKENA